MKLKWEVIHECDDENGNPTEWAAEINHPKYGQFCWIDDMSDNEKTRFSVFVDNGTIEMKELVRYKSLTSAKRWVARNLV